MAADMQKKVKKKEFWFFFFDLDCVLSGYFFCSFLWIAKRQQSQKNVFYIGLLLELINKTTKNKKKTENQVILYDN